MKFSKALLRSRALLERKKKHSKVKKFNFNLLFSLIKRNFSNRKISIAGYYPSNYEVDVIKFIKEAVNKNFKVSLPVIGPSNSMCFRSWSFQEPLYLNKFGIPEPKDSNKEIIPDLIIVPLVAFDKHLNRIGYGKGYYDRSLNKINKTKKKTIFLGVAYSFQKCNIIPTNKYDFKLDYILTEQGIIG